MNASNVVAIVPPSAQDETAPTERSAARSELAAAIASAWKKTCAVSAARDALERAQAGAAIAVDDAAVAVAAIASARERDAEAVAAGIRTRSGAAPSATRKARQKAELAEDEAEIARVAVGKLEFDLAAAEEKAAAAKLRVDSAVNAVLAIEAAPLIERLETIKSEIPALQASLHFVRSRGMIDHGTYAVESPELAEPLKEILPRIAPALEHGVLFNLLAAKQHPAFARWQAAVNALAGDPDAPLPI